MTLSKQHEVVQYIDDSSSIIAFQDIQDIHNYLSLYIDILQNYYAMNLLKMNKCKTILLLASCKKSENLTLKIKIDNELIISQKQIKILGSQITSDISPVADFNKTIQICNSNLSKLIKIQKHLNPKTRAIFVKSYVLSRLQYMAFSYVNLPEYVIQKVRKLIMGSARFCRGNYGFRISCQDILSEFQLLSAKQFLYNLGLNVIEKIIQNKKPELIYNMIKKPDRSCKDLRMLRPPISSNISKINYLPKLLLFFNSLPSNFKTLDSKKLRKLVGKSLRASPTWDWLKGFPRQYG